MKNKINHHCAVSIVRAENAPEFLLGVYDQTYPNESQRGKANLLGGNYKIGDYSTLELFKREISEEFRRDSENQIDLDRTVANFVGEVYPSIHNNHFADKEIVDRVRGSILKETIPYKDFVIRLPTKQGIEVDVLHSVFLTLLDKETFEIIKDNLSLKRRINSETNVKIVHLEELVSGKVPTAYGAGPIIQDYTKTLIPFCSQIPNRVIGQPRNSFSDYLSEFSYTCETMRHLNPE